MHNDAHLLFPHSVMQAMSNQQVTALPTEQIVKLREREGKRVDLGRSLKGHL